MHFFYTYALENNETGERYIGFTKDLKKRLEMHRSGHGGVTTKRGSYKLIYWEACVSEEDARRREKYFKTTNGRRFLAQRLKDFYGRA